MLRKKLSDDNPAKELGISFNSFDIVGEIAIIKLPKDGASNGERIARQIMARHNKVKTVLAQTSSISTDFRIRNLKCLYGENKTETKYKENGCVFAVDVARCYFSPRLSRERARIASLVKTDEIVVNMFAGVGCFSIIIARSEPKTKVYSIDINSAAFRHMVQNIRVNRVFGKVLPLFGDSKEIIQSKLQNVADRVLMPLPEKALEYLPYAVLALKENGWIHYYDFQHARGNENPIEKTKQKISEKLERLNVDFAFPSSRIVRSTGPNWYQTVIEILVTKRQRSFNS